MVANESSSSFFQPSPVELIETAPTPAGGVVQHQYPHNDVSKHQISTQDAVAVAAAADVVSSSSSSRSTEEGLDAIGAIRRSVDRWEGRQAAAAASGDEDDGDDDDAPLVANGAASGPGRPGQNWTAAAAAAARGQLESSDMPSPEEDAAELAENRLVRSTLKSALKRPPAAGGDTATATRLSLKSLATKKKRVRFNEALNTFLECDYVIYVDQDDADDDDDDEYVDEYDDVLYDYNADVAHVQLDANQHLQQQQEPVKLVNVRSFDLQLQSVESGSVDCSSYLVSSIETATATRPTDSQTLSPPDGYKDAAFAYAQALAAAAAAAATAAAVDKQQQQLQHLNSRSSAGNFQF